ncbi:MAG: 4-alpha-glucanotransferase [Gallintestinimicrobium sp.]
MVRAYLNRPTESKQVLASELVRTTIASVADTCIIPIQDYLGLDNSARINFPSTLGTNWRWRLIKSDLTKALADSIRKQNIVYGRVKWEDLQEDEKAEGSGRRKETETEPKQKKTVL